MALADLTELQRQELILNEINPDGYDLVQANMPLYWILYSQEPGMLQDLMSKRAAIDCLIGEVRKLVNTTLGQQKYELMDQVENLQQMRLNTEAEMTRLRGSFRIIPSTTRIPSAYDDEAAVRRNEFGR